MQPLKSDLDSDPLLPFAGSNEPVIESLGDPVEELREAVEMLNDTARKRGHSQSHDHSIQDLINKVSKNNVFHCSLLTLKAVSTSAP